jgi:mycofactocin precursor
METDVSKQEMKVPELREDSCETPAILEEITVEEMAVDGICGIY